MYKYIINPLTKKKVNVKSKLGKKILQNYLNLKLGSGHPFGIIPKSKKKIPPSLEKIEEETTCPIKRNQFCQNITIKFQSPFNILNYISHNKDGELNDINFEEKLYKRLERKEFVNSGKEGDIFDNIFKNNETENQIRISEKILKKNPDDSDDDDDCFVLDEVKLLQNYPKISELCPNIIPIKILDNKIYTLRGNGDLTQLIKKIDIDAAHQIVNCIKKTLLCLFEHDIYYFDLKPDNIIYHCIDNTMYIWLIDLGSMVPDEDTGDYIATYPHPIINCLSTFNYAGLIICDIYESDEQVKDIYAYQLSQLFFNLLGLNRHFDYNFITDNSYEKLKNDLQCVIKEIKSKIDYEDKLIKKYIGVFEEIINGITALESDRKFTSPCHKNFWQ